MKSIKNTVFLLLITISISLPAQNKAFEVNVVGNGSPILFFPGFTCPGEVWDDMVAELSKTNQCHVFTFAGFGNVPAIEKPWLPKIYKGILDYINQNNIENSTVIGHSLGGTLGLWLASENASAFNKIIVVDALPSTGALMVPNFNSENIVYDNPYNQRLLDMDDENFEAMAAQMAAGMVLNKEKQDQIKQWILKTDRKTYVYGYTDLLKLDLRAPISQITAPVVILAATQPYGLENVKMTYEAQYNNLKNCTIYYAEESAHFIMHDQPAWLLKHINEALQ